MARFDTDKRLQTIGISRFVADGHLGGLTRNLRLLGFDVAYRQNADDRQLLDVMVRENRALLTRDRRLLMHAIVQHGYWPRSQNADEQTIEVVRRFDLSELIAPFTRCLRCNAPLEDGSQGRRNRQTRAAYQNLLRPVPSLSWTANRSIGRARTFLNCKSESKKFAHGFEAKHRLVTSLAELADCAAICSLHFRRARSLRR